MLEGATSLFGRDIPHESVRLMIRVNNMGEPLPKRKEPERTLPIPKKGSFPFHSPMFLHVPLVRGGLDESNARSGDVSGQARKDCNWYV